MDDPVERTYDAQVLFRVTASSRREARAAAQAYANVVENAGAEDVILTSVRQLVEPDAVEQASRGI